MYTIEEFDREKSKIMNYIMYKKRTEKEVKNKFQNTCAEDLLCDIISYIKEAGYLDDIDYIERTIKEFMKLKSLSEKEIKYKLYQKGISKSDLDDYLHEHKEEIEEYERKSAKQIYNKKSSLGEEYISNYLIKKGYREDIIKEVLECKMY